MPNAEMLVLSRRLVVMQGPELHLYARFSGRCRSVHWTLRADASRTSVRSLDLDNMHAPFSTYSMSFSGAQALQSWLVGLGIGQDGTSRGAFGGEGVRSIHLESSTLSRLDNLPTPHFNNTTTTRLQPTEINNLRLP